MPTEATPRVTVITPAYNAEHFIERCIDSMLAQTFTSWEQIVVDDGSTDATASLVERYRDPRVHYIPLSHRGIAALAETYNTALAVARGDLIGVLEGDDEWLPHKLERQVPLFDDPDVMVSWGRALVIDGAGTVSRRWDVPRSCQRDFDLAELFRVLARWNVLSPALTVMIRRSALESIGGFQQTGSQIMVDLPTWLTLTGRVKGKAAYLDDDIGYYRIYTTNTGTLQNARMRMEHNDIFTQIRQQLGPNRLRELGWTARDERVTVASSSMTRGIAHMQMAETAAARSAFAKTLTHTRSAREFAIAGLGYACALTGINLMPRMQQLSYALSSVALRAGSVMKKNA